MKAASCPLCGGAAASTYEAREMMIGTRERFRYGECEGCRSLVLVDVPDDLGRYYPDDYYSLRPLSSSSAPRRRLKRARARAAAGGRWRTATLLGAGKPPPWLRWIEVAGLDRSASICDIGCGRGELLFELAAAGFAETVGIDPLVPEAVDRDGVRIHRAEAGEVEGSFDLVMFNHSFEHLAEPLAGLTAARRLLAPGGTLMLRTPVAGSWAWRHYGVDWVALDPPRHLFVPTIDGLQLALATVGLELYSKDFDSTELQFWRSEQYRADVALFEPGSHQLDPSGSPFSRRQIRGWRREAARLNRSGEGDTVAAFSRAAGPASA